MSGSGDGDDDGRGSGRRHRSRRRERLLWGAVGALLAGVLINGYALATGTGIDAWAVGLGMVVAGVGTTGAAALVDRLAAPEGGNESA